MLIVLNCYVCCFLFVYTMQMGWFNLPGKNIFSVIYFHTNVYICIVCNKLFNHISNVK